MDQLEKPSTVSEKLFENTTDMFTEHFVFVFMG